MNIKNRILIVGTKKTVHTATQSKINPTAKLIGLPIIDTQLIDNISFTKKNYDWLIFTSPAAVKHFKDLSNKPTFNKTAVIGPSTKKVADSLNISTNFIPKVYNADSFAAELLPLMNKDSKILFPCSSIADNTLQEFFDSKAIYFERVNLYTTYLLPKLELPSFDSIVFLSGSSVEAMYEYYGKEVIRGKKIAAIGNKAAKKVNELFAIQSVTPAKSTAIETIKMLL